MHGTNLAMLNSATRSWIELSKNETGMRLRRAVVVLSLNGFGASRWTKCPVCFVQQGHGHLHEFRTLGTDETIRQMTKALKETELLATLEGGNLIALDAKYHLQCLTSLRNRYRSLLRQREQE